MSIHDPPYIFCEYITSSKTIKQGMINTQFGTQWEGDALGRGGQASQVLVMFYFVGLAADTWECIL